MSVAKNKRYHSHVTKNLKQQTSRHYLSWVDNRDACWREFLSRLKKNKVQVLFNIKNTLKEIIELN